ncbi:sensor histidine kinase [Spirosoma radiotolerans]|uniref:histidine kinase n=1 Tax=Spirosoma radiotolerans TaxID=1379870 RepID=A0A0E3V6L0_9BACT|nr:sensor histidine kinase [Spirosoma radiotolerans]AKD54631.1 histidine kinase [Spirosoma radiotolerans]
MPDTLNDNTKDGSVIPVRFTRLYMTLLIILAVLLTVGQGLTQWRLRAVQDELWIIRYSALQRHQSQQIVKQVLQLADASEQDHFSENVAALRQVFPVFERYHLQSRQGKVDNPKVYIVNSDTVQRLYDAIRPQFDAFRQSAHRLMRLQRFDEIKTPEVQASIKLMLANEKPFLEEMDGIVREYTTELRAKLTLLQSIELYLYIFTVAVLIGIGFVIFRPAARRLKQTFAQLVEAESQTTAANKKLLNANRILKETRQKLFEATKLQYQQEIDDQKLRTSYLIAGQEEERKRLSRELHDGLGQMLTAIKLQIEGLEASLTRAAATEQVGTAPHAKNLKTLKSLVTQTIQETRTISNNLMPSVLSDFGIIPAIKMLAEQDRSDSFDVTFETNFTSDMPRLNKNVEIMLYRVTQEAVSNAVKHAKPSHIHIELYERSTFLQLIVSDDGKGFQVPRKKQENGGLKQKSEINGDITNPSELRPPSQGLHNMQERTKLLNGKFKLQSAFGKGTKIQVSIPYKTHFASHDTY